jgi:hypothetical protein
MGLKMKAQKDVLDMASRLNIASLTPLVQPAQLQPVAAPPVAAPPSEAARVYIKKAPDTVQITLRPTRDLLSAYVVMAADRSKLEGRTVTTQEMMMEILAGAIK